METEMRRKFQMERLRIEGGKPNFKLLEFSNSWIGIVSVVCRTSPFEPLYVHPLLRRAL